LPRIRHAQTAFVHRIRHHHRCCRNAYHPQLAGGEAALELGSPAAFGEIVYQNLSLTNDGWNPATNVKLFLRHPA